MGENVEQYAETIALLRKEIKAKDRDIQLAATFGKQLLEEREAINLKTQSRIENIQSKLECLEQEKYSLQFDLETQTQTVKTQASELEVQNELVDSLQKKVQVFEKETTVLKQRCSNSAKEKCDLEKCQEDLQAENSSLKNKIRLLEQQLEHCQESAKFSANETTSEEDLPDINLYIAKNKELQDALSELQYELESVKLKESQLVNLVKKLEEAVSEKDQEISSHSTEMKKAHEFAAELQCEIEMLKLDQLDVNRRGNSMFGELDDRRKLVEKEYKLLRTKYENVLKNYEENKNELIQCKGHMTILMSMTSKKYQDTYIEKLESMLSDARRNNETLSLKLNKAMKNYQHQNVEQVMSKSDQYDYLRVLYQQAEKKVKDLENELMTSRMQIINLEESLASANYDIFKSKKDINDLRTENLKLKQEIKDLTSKPDVDGSDKPKPKIEILPGFETNAETQKIFKLRNNEENNEDMPENESVQTKSLKSDTIKYNSQSPSSVLKESNVEKEQIPAVSILEDDNTSGGPDKNKRNVNCAQQ